MAGIAPPAPVRRYDVIAIEMPIVFNFDGDHDHNGLIYALKHNQSELEVVRSEMRDNPHSKWHKTPHHLVRPLVLRARVGERVEIYLQNQIRGRSIGIHLVADGYNVKTSDGAHVGRNPSSLVGPGGVPAPARPTYVWDCQHEGVFPFHDAGNLSGGEDGTNVHGLFGALVVEPPQADWTDPVTGDPLTDGLYADVHPKGLAAAGSRTKKAWDSKPDKYPSPEASFREYVVFFHDEPEFLPAHEPVEPPPCPEETGGHGGERAGGGFGHGQGGRDRDGEDVLDAFGRHRGGGGSEHEGPLPIMPISYRAEPMVNRERKLWRMIREGKLKKPVIGEEQHHSSWLFGDPATPILRAYVGDPVRIRLVHAAVKETHVFHQHVYQWHADPCNQKSPIIDSVSISPQTGHTIELLYGAGSSQGAVGDAVFHCHLYPHFHEGMWGILRTFDRLQDGSREYPHDAETPEELITIEELQSLPDRPVPPASTPSNPGFPLFIAGEYRQKSPVPPWPEDLPDFGPMPPDLDYRPLNEMTDRERSALNSKPMPGALFNLHPFEATLPVIRRDMAVVLTPLLYNDDGWHDPHGHVFVLADHRPRPKQGQQPIPPDPQPGMTEDATAEQFGRIEPLVVRGHRKTVVQTTLDNRLPATIPGTAFDLPFPPCDFFPTPLGECGLHVHLVKFDPLVSDGASVGWNYMTGPQVGKKMIYRWHVDEEFGTVFFHDHLFANYRQKHGLFGAFIVEPQGATFLDPLDPESDVTKKREIKSGVEAVIAPGGGAGDAKFPPFREFCLAVADFIPQFDRRGEPLNPPEFRGGHGDQGVMAVNYRSEPIRERGGDPAFWFLSRRHEYDVTDAARHWPRRRARVRHGDPSTHVFEAHEGDPVRIRLFQGSHEEQHSFQIHGMRWRQFLNDPASRWRNQQTIGISEAFSFALHRGYSAGDHLWKFGASDDLWLGCWGLIRVHPPGTGTLPPLPPAPAGTAPPNVHTPPDVDTASATIPPTRTEYNTRRFVVVAERRPIVYRERDLIDPFGLVYRLVRMIPPRESGGPTPTPEPDLPGPADYAPVEPLILRCCEGEWVQIDLVNHLPLGMEPEPFAPLVPVERHDRPVSSRVSMHADLLRYDVRDSDGANVGLNPIQSAEPARPDPDGSWPGGTEAERTATYLWYADEAFGPVLLQDMADFRNHRHHGLIGALIVEPQNANVSDWFGPRATVHGSDGTPNREEVVLILQDGLRLFFHGNKNFPVPDEPDLADDPGGDRPDVEDQGQRGFNYRSEPTGEPWWLDINNPATPVFEVAGGSPVSFHLVGGSDKPRNYSFTIHGHTWVARHMSEAGRRVGAVSAVTSGWVETFDLDPVPAGDYAYRAGVLKWALVQGLWGILRVR